MQPYLVIITGESGAGKSTALRTFEDLDFLAIDNFPIRLLKSYLKEVSESKLTDKLAMVVDLRDPYFLEEFPKVYKDLRKEYPTFELLYLTAKTEVLITRYNQTRRPHPLLREEKNIESAVKKEKELLSFLKDYATYIIETSNFTYHQLRSEIQRIFGRGKNLHKPFLHIISFGFKYGLPFEANYIFDVRALPNPYFVPDLKPLPGTDERIIRYLLADTKTEKYLKGIEEFLRMVISFHLTEGRRYLAIGIGCTGGRHRSPAISQLLYQRLKEEFEDLEIGLTLRDIARED
jgi:Predicted P-loop-containing kinase